MVDLRRSEAADALDILGVDPSFVVHLDFEDGALSRSADGLADALADVLRETKPDQVLVTSHSDRHPDHVAVARTARTVTPLAGHDVKLYEFPIWQRVPAFVFARSAVGGVRNRAGVAQPHGRPTLVQTDAFLTVKERAIQAYESQLEHFPLGFIEDFLLPFESFLEVVPPRQSSK